VDTIQIGDDDRLHWQFTRGDEMAIIPTKNPAALIGYYLGVGCLIPLLGFVLSLPALICGIIGIIKAKSDPQAGGMGHAITAIVLSIFGPLVWVVLLMVLGFLGGR
jgi:hypothetical protein